MKRLILAGLLSLAMVTPCRAMTAHEQALSYIEYDQDLPQAPGDMFYRVKDEQGRYPVLLTTTAYCEGKTGCRGDSLRRGHVAYMASFYGYAVQMYKAVKTDDGYILGDYLGIYEVKDTGYGHETGKGKSAVRPDKKSRGSIESGEMIDTYFPTYSECVTWMEETDGLCFAIITPAKG